MFENGEGRRMLRTDDRQSQSHWYTMSSLMSLRLSELKMLGFKLWKISLTSIFIFVLGAQKNLPIEMILLST